jgi:ureidoacrylate peracid hydrolase
LPQHRIKVIYTTHAHRRDSCDMGLFDDLHPPVANRTAVFDGTWGAEMYPEVAPAAGEHVIKKLVTNANGSPIER